MVHDGKRTDYWVWFLTPLSTNYSAGQFYLWSKMESTEKTTDLPQVTGKLCNVLSRQLPYVSSSTIFNSVVRKGPLWS
jgi:hypothetical protein